MAKRKAKTVSKAKQDLSDLAANESKAEPSFDPRGVVSLNPMVRSVVECVPVCRQPDTINKYNPEGITLAAIDMEMIDARGPQDETDWQLIDLFYGKKPIQAVHSSPDQYIMRTGFAAPACSVEKRDKRQSEDVRKFIQPQQQPISQPYIEANDDYFADRIKQNPLALLKCPAAQDAWSRWSYAASWGHDSLTTRQANKYLKLCKPKGGGRRTRVIIDKKQLLRAYDDCCTYIKCLYKCADALKDAGKVLEFFPDANALAGFNVILSEITNPKMRGPAPSDVAAEYIAHSCRLSASRVMDLITETRNKTKERKTKPA